MSDHVIRRVVIHGRVQGVGYRDWTRHAARGRAIEGWVRNRRDGSVEAVLSGSSDAVSGMIAACRTGPSSARVEWIDEQDAAQSDLEMRRPNESFSVLITL
jgi:acylphosphatase